MKPIVFLGHGVLDGRDLELGAPDHAHHLGDRHAHIEGLLEGRMVFVELGGLAGLRLAQLRDLFTIAPRPGEWPSSL